MTEDPTVERGQRDVDTGGAEIGDEQVPGGRPERKLPWRAAARTRPDSTLCDQPAVDQLADSPADDRPSETGPPDQFRSRARPAQTDLVEDGHEIVEDLVRQRHRGYRAR